MNDWQEYKFREIVNFPPSVKLTKGVEYPFIAMEDVNPSNKFVSEAVTKKYTGSNPKFKNGDILFARITPSLDNKKISVAKMDTKEFGFGSTEFFIFRAKPKVADQNFVYYLCKSDLIVQNAINSYVGASGRQRADGRFIKNVKIQLPPLPEQEKIAAVLSAYDDLIENNNRRIAILQEMAEQIYREWFVRLRFPGWQKTEFEKGVPKRWKLEKILKHIDILSGGTPSTEIAGHWDGEIPFFTPRDVGIYPFVFDTEKNISESGLQNCNSRYFSEDTIFITARGTVGKLVIAGIKMAMNQTNYAIVSKGYLSQYFIYLTFYELILSLKQSASGATFDAITLRDFDRLEIIIPEQNILKRFEQNLNDFYREIKCLQSKNINLKQTRDSLLPRLISGKISLKDIKM